MFLMMAAAMSAGVALADYDRAAADRARDGIVAEIESAVVRAEKSVAGDASPVSLAGYAAKTRIVDGRRVWTDAFNAALAANASVTVPAAAEPYWLDGEIRIGPGRRLQAEKGAVMKRVPGSMLAMIRNAAWENGIAHPVAGRPDEGIVITGGRWDAGCTKRVSYSPSIFSFSNVRGLVVRDLEIAGAPEFAIQIGDAEDVRVTDVNFDACKADGVHVNGNVRFIHVARLTGRVGDDFVALNAFDWPKCTFNFGTIDHALVEDIALRSDMRNSDEDFCKSMRLLPGLHRYADGSERLCCISNVVVRRVNGLRSFKVYCQTPPYGIKEGPLFRDMRPGKEDNLFFEDLSVDLDHPTDGVIPNVRGDRIHGRAAAWEFGAEIGRAYIRNVDVRANLPAYPMMSVAQVAPKHMQLGSREGGDPYFDVSVAQLVLDDVRIHGGRMAEPVAVFGFDDVNGDGRSSGTATLGKLVKRGVRETGPFPDESLAGKGVAAEELAGKTEGQKIVLFVDRIESRFRDWQAGEPQAAADLKALAGEFRDLVETKTRK